MPRRAASTNSASSAAEYLSRENHFVIVNYHRKALGQEWGGHISPLAAYDEKADRFLILDVARYKYPPVWVTTSDLFDAMNTPDPDNENKARGYVLIAGMHPRPRAGAVTSSRLAPVAASSGPGREGPARTSISCPLG